MGREFSVEEQHEYRNWISRYWVCILNDAERSVLWYIVSYTIDFGRTSWIFTTEGFQKGFRTRDGELMGLGLRIDRSKLFRALKSLEEEGMIFRERLNRASRITVNLDYNIVESERFQKKCGN